MPPNAVPTRLQPHTGRGIGLCPGRYIIVVAAAALLLMACSPNRLIVRQFGAVVETGLKDLEASGDVALVEAGLPGQITLMEALLANAPGDERLRLLLARLYAAHGLLFMEPLVEAAVWEVKVPWRDGGGPPNIGLQRSQLARVFQRGARHALAVLERQRGGSQAQLSHINRIGPYLQSAGREEVPALFWYALNLGAWVNHHLDDLGAIAQAHVAERIMRRVVALEPDYYHGFAHLFLIAYYGGRPPMLGGRPNTARQHYDAYRALAESSPTATESVSVSLGAVYYARYCLPQQQAREAFIGLLAPIAQRSIDVDTGLFDALAIRRARLYLHAVDRLFD